MANKFSKLYKATNTKEKKLKNDGIETAKARLSMQTKGEKENKDVFLKIRLTAEEKQRWQEYAKDNSTVLSVLIRDIMNNYIRGKQ